MRIYPQMGPSKENDNTFFRSFQGCMMQPEIHVNYVIEAEIGSEVRRTPETHFRLECR